MSQTTGVLLSREDRNTAIVIFVDRFRLAMSNATELLSDELLQQIEEIARAQNRKPAEVLKDAVQAYAEEQSWQALVRKAEERNRVNGRTEEDVPRFAEEVRRENRERGR